MFGPSNCTISGTTGELVTRSTIACSSSNPGRMIEVIVFRPVEDRRLLQKGMRDPVARLEQSPHHFLIERLFNHEEAVLVKRSALLGCEAERIS